MTGEFDNQCPSSMELTRQYFELGEDGLGEHVRNCPACSAEVDSIRSLVDAYGRLPDGKPSPGRADEVLSSVLRDSRLGERSRRRRPVVRYFAVAAAVLIAITSGILIAMNLEESEIVTSKVTQVSTRAKVHSVDKASHVLVSKQPDEMVRLTDGTITVEVEKLAPNERFRVVVGDAEVEVHGTVFEVTAKDDRLVGVRVMSGKVEVRPMDRETVMLNPGQRWEMAVAENRSEESSGGEAPKLDGSGVEIAPVRSERQRPGLARSEREAGISSAEASFNHAWDELRAGKHASAAELFGRAVEEGGTGSFVEDALFWKAISHDRAGARAEAVSTMKDFLARYPESSRQGEVSAMLGWKLLELGDTAGARRLFERAVNDPASRVSESAASGLSRIDKAH